MIMTPGGTVEILTHRQLEMLQRLCAFVFPLLQVLVPNLENISLLMFFEMTDSSFNESANGFNHLRSRHASHLKYTRGTWY